MAEPILEARGIIKTFGHVHALRGANFAAHAGEVVALVGDNGAGKSTLAKCLSGVYQPDDGEMLLEGRQVRFSSPVAALHLGIETVYQDLALADDLEASANLFLGRELTMGGGRLRWLGILDQRRMRAESVAAFKDLGVSLQDANMRLASLSGGQRQSVAVARSAIWASKAILMDEPTAALGVVQRQHVLELVRRVRDLGVAVVFISHNMPEVLEIADRIEVFRLGLRVGRFKAGETTVEQLVGAMTGALKQEDAA